MQLSLRLGLFALAELFYTLFHGEGALVQLVVAHESPEVQLCRRCLKLGDLGLVLLVFLELLLKTALPLHGVEAVIAGVELRLAVRYLHTALGHDVEEIAVVADGQHGAAEVENVVLQPLRGAHVEVVSRLVQQEDVRVLEYEPREIHAGLFAAGEQGELAPAHLGGDVEAVGDAVALVVHVVAAEAAKIVRELVIFFEQRLAAVRGHEALELLHSRGHGPQAGVRLAQHVLGGPALGVDGDLAYESHAPPAAYGRRALVGLQLAGEDAEERGLAAAVGAEYTHALPGRDFKGQPVQHRMADLEGFFQVLYAYVSHFSVPARFISI